MQYCIHICLPEDEPKRFEKCRRQQKLKNNLENSAFPWFVLFNFISMIARGNGQSNTNMFIAIPT